MGQGLSNTNVLGTESLGLTQRLIESGIASLQSSTDSRAGTLLVKYNTLNSEVAKTIQDLSGISPDLLNAKQNQYNSKIIELNIEKKNILENSTEITAKSVFKIITYSAGMVFAMIIISHTFIDKNIFLQIFYCVWGALLYPIVLLYGIYSPPAWKAILIPFVKNDSEAKWQSNIIAVTLLFPFRYNESASIDGDAKSKFALQLFAIVCTVAFGVAYVI
jgi:hypothetical protein